MSFFYSLALSEIELASIRITVIIIKCIIIHNFPIATLFVLIHFLKMALISAICCLSALQLENNLLVLRSDVLQVEYDSFLAQHRLSRLRAFHD